MKNILFSVFCFLICQKTYAQEQISLESFLDGLTSLEKTTYADVFSNEDEKKIKTMFQLLESLKEDDLLKINQKILLTNYLKEKKSVLDEQQALRLAEIEKSLLEKKKDFLFKNIFLTDASLKQKIKDAQGEEQLINRLLDFATKHKNEDNKNKEALKEVIFYILETAESLSEDLKNKLFDIGFKEKSLEALLKENRFFKNDFKKMKRARKWSFLAKEHLDKILKSQSEKEYAKTLVLLANTYQKKDPSQFQFIVQKIKKILSKSNTELKKFIFEELSQSEDLYEFFKEDAKTALNEHMGIAPKNLFDDFVKTQNLTDQFDLIINALEKDASIPKDFADQALIYLKIIDAKRVLEKQNGFKAAEEKTLDDLLINQSKLDFPPTEKKEDIQGVAQKEALEKRDEAPTNPFKDTVEKKNEALNDQFKKTTEEKDASKQEDFGKNPLDPKTTLEEEIKILKEKIKKLKEDESLDKQILEGVIDDLSKENFLNENDKKEFAFQVLLEVEKKEDIEQALHLLEIFRQKNLLQDLDITALEERLNLKKHFDDLIRKKYDLNQTDLQKLKQKIYLALVDMEKDDASLEVLSNLYTQLEPLLANETFFYNASQFYKKNKDDQKAKEFLKKAVDLGSVEAKKALLEVSNPKKTTPLKSSPSSSYGSSYGSFRPAYRPSTSSGSYTSFQKSYPQKLGSSEFFQPIRLPQMQTQGKNQKLEKKDKDIKTLSQKPSFAKKDVRLKALQNLQDTTPKITLQTRKKSSPLKQNQKISPLAFYHPPFSLKLFPFEKHKNIKDFFPKKDMFDLSLALSYKNPVSEILHKNQTRSFSMVS